MSVIGGAQGIAAMLMAACASVALADDVNRDPSANTGRAPGGAFYFDLRNGFDDDFQWKADYVMDAPWFATGYTPANVKFDKTGMTLLLQRKQMAQHAHTGAEFQISGFYGYGRFETIMKAPNISGSVASFFTHTDSYFDDPHDEIDFEWLGKNPRAVELNYFAGGKPRGAKTIALPFDASKAHHHYAFEWLPDSIKWYVDGELVHEVFAGNGKMPIPTASGRVMSNIWAAKSTTLDWTGPVLFDTVSAHYVCMSHVPMGKTGRQCGDIPLGDVGKQK